MSQLVLARRKGEALRIGEVEITVVRLTESKVRLSIDAPDKVSIVRMELLEKCIERRQLQGHSYEEAKKLCLQFIGNKHERRQHAALAHNTHQTSQVG